MGLEEKRRILWQTAQNGVGKGLETESISKKDQNGVAAKRTWIFFEMKKDCKKMQKDQPNAPLVYMDVKFI